MKAQELYSKRFISAIEKTSDKIDNPIYVLYGDMSILNLDQYEGWIIDKDTFASTGGEEVFTKDWFADDNEIDILLDQIISGKEKTPAFYIKLYEKQPALDANCSLS